MEGYDIEVALTTTQHVEITSKENTSREVEYFLLNFPCCFSKTYLPLFNLNEDIYDNISNEIILGLKKVVVDTEKHSVYIGPDNKKMYSSVIEYSSEQTDKYSLDFFNRWKEIKSLFLQFSIISKLPQTNPQQYLNFITIAGIWTENRWKWLSRICRPIFFINQ